MVEAPQTEEGWFALHDFRSIDWDGWRDAPERERRRAIEEGEAFLKHRELVADAEEEAFRWVSTYSITHFDFPFLSFGHPTLGDDECERKYSDSEWRRLTFKDGKLIGGVLIGDLSQQSTFKKLIREEREVADKKELLLEEDVDLEKLEEIAPAQAE